MLNHTAGKVKTWTPLARAQPTRRPGPPRDRRTGRASLLIVLSWLLASILHPAAGEARQQAASPVRILFGVNMHPLQDTYAHYSPAETLRLAAAIGAQIVRVDVYWDWIEYTGSAAADWYLPQLQALDAFLDEAARRHLRVLATVLETPCWASNEPDKICPPGPSRYHGNYPPVNPQDFGDFLAKLVDHVGPRIQYYEIWNEPNLDRFWRSPDPLAYTRLLQAAYPAIKSHNPRAVVVAGATSGADASFISGMYAAGARPYFDALSVHPYSRSHSPDVCTIPQRSFRCGIEAVRRVMLRNGDTRPIWLTELGEPVAGGISAVGQARYLQQAFSLVRRWSYVRAAIWYELYDDPTGHDGQHFGLFGWDLCPRPAAFAFREAVDPGARAAPGLQCSPTGPGTRKPRTPPH